MPSKIQTGWQYGQMRHVYEAAGLTASEWVYPAGLEMATHAHSTALFCITLQGCYTEAGRLGRQGYPPLGFVLHPPGVEHGIRIENTETHIFSLEIEPAWIERVKMVGSRFECRGHAVGGPPAWLALRLCREVREPDTATPLAIEGLMLELFVALWRHQMPAVDTGSPRWLRQAIEYLRANYRETFALNEVAVEVGVHPVHLARTFRRRQGCTVGDYLRKLRVEYACHRLTHETTPLVEIALDAGFCDQSQFGKVFRQEIGVTPAQFRRSLQGG